MDQKEAVAENEAPDLVSLTADIVSTYPANNRTRVAEIAEVIAAVQAALGGPGKPKIEPLVPPVPIKKRITPDAMISLEDGKR